MKYIYLVFITIFLSTITHAQNVGVGTQLPHTSAKLDVTSNVSGFLPPRMTFAQRNAIVNPPQGLIIFCTNCGPNGQAQNFDGVQWLSINAGLASPFLATITTAIATSITSTSANCGGNISSDGGAMVTRRGLIYSTSAIVDTTTITGGGKIIDAATGVGNYTMSLAGLLASTTYHIRAFAVNLVGVSYGADLTFTTLQAAANLSNVTICSQVWTLYNLDVTTYRNGDSIPQVPDTAVWSHLTSGAWRYYNNNPANNATYGKLYNWYAVNDSRGLAPQGWHVPSEAEWTKLVDTCLGGSPIAGSKMKEIGTAHWTSPNAGATNSSGFTALGGGYFFQGLFYDFGNNGFWWSVTENSTLNATGFILGSAFAGAYVSPFNEKISGFSVRLIKD